MFGVVGDLEDEPTDGAKSRGSTRDTARPDPVSIADAGAANYNVRVALEEVDDVRIDAAISSIRDSLLENLPRVVDIFRNFDVDGSGTVSREEFLRVLPLMRNVDVSDDELDLLFDAIDRDGSGEIELRELQKVMRRGADVKLAKELQPGAMGRIETESTNAIALRTSARGGLRLSGDDDAYMCLRAAIAEVLTKGTDPVAGEMTPWVSTVVSTA